MADAASIIELWFSDPIRPLWFNSNPAFDQLLTEKFLDVYRMAVEGGLQDWETTPSGAVARVLLLDQFPLNMFRGKPESFMTEAESRKTARRAIELGLDAELDNEQKAFMYMPFMHSETLSDQDYCVELCAAAGLTKTAEFARHHQSIVRRFGRFPHRNAILGRVSTPEELDYLASENAFLG